MHLALRGFALSEATAVAEEVVTQPESTPSTPSSEASPAVTEEVTAPGTGEEAPGAGEAPVTPDPVDPAQRYAELAAKIDKDGLTPSEGAELKRIGQSLSDRNRDESDRIQKARQNEARVTQAATQLYDFAAAEFDQIEARERALAEEEGRSVSPALIKRQQRELLNTLKDNGERIHQWPVHLDLNERIRNLQAPSARLEEWLQNPQVSIQQKLDFLQSIPVPPSKEHVVMTQKDLDARLQGAAKKALDDFKAANPGSAPPAGGGANTLTGNLTLAQIDAMPMNQWMSYPREERTRLLDAAHRAAGR